MALLGALGAQKGNNLVCNAGDVLCIEMTLAWNLLGAQQVVVADDAVDVEARRIKNKLKERKKKAAKKNAL